MSNPPGAKIYQFPTKAKPAAAEQTPLFTFKDFHIQIAENHMSDAEKSIAHLLGLSPTSAKSAAEFYKTRLSENPNHVMQTMALRSLAQNDVSNDLLQQISECFGLQGSDALLAVAKLKAN